MKRWTSSAVQAYLWAIPLVSFAQGQEQHEQVFGAEDGDLIFYVSYHDKLGLLTSNATTPYLLGFPNLSRTGPLVIDVPAGQIAGGILDRAAKSAYKMSRVFAFDEVVTGRSLRMYPDRRWVNPMADATAENPSGKLDLSWRRVDCGGALDVDLRPWFFSNYYSVSPGMLSQIPGKGAFYIIAFTDGDGAPLTGGTNYRLNLPKDVPAANFWSVTLYEAENATGLANGQTFPSLGSCDNPVQNADGSTDLYLGPKPRRARRGTGSPRCPAEGTSSFCGFTGRPSRRSRAPGSPAT